MPRFARSFYTQLHVVDLYSETPKHDPYWGDDPCLNMLILALTPVGPEKTQKGKAYLAKL